MKKTINSLMIIVVLFFAANQYFIGQFLDSASASSPVSSGFTLRDNANESEIIAAILPNDADTLRPYKWQGQPVTLSAQVPGNGYDMLVAMNKIKLASADQQGTFSALTKDIYHPCCDAPISSCGCKHSVAAQGLIKYLITEGYSNEQIKDEVFLWNRYWWPRHYATAAIYLNSQGTNPSAVSTADWLGPNLSTIRSGRKMKAILGK